MNHEHHHTQLPGTGSRGRLALVVFLAIAAFFLLSEHRAHVFGFLPYLLLLACPLMHLFHHGGHGGHGRHRAEPSPDGKNPPHATKERSPP